jgi:hypothetical protein
MAKVESIVYCVITIDIFPEHICVESQLKSHSLHSNLRVSRFNLNCQSTQLCVVNIYTYEYDNLAVYITHSMGALKEHSLIFTFIISYQICYIFFYYWHIFMDMDVCIEHGKKLYLFIEECGRMLLVYIINLCACHISH